MAVGLARLALPITLRVGWIPAAYQLLLLLRLLLQRLRGVGRHCCPHLLLLLRGIGSCSCRDRRLLLRLLPRHAAGALRQLPAHRAPPARHAHATIGI